MCELGIIDWRFIFSEMYSHNVISLYENVGWQKKNISYHSW